MGSPEYSSEGSFSGDRQGLVVMVNEIPNSSDVVFERL